MTSASLKQSIELICISCEAKWGTKVSIKIKYFWINNNTKGVTQKQLSIKSTTSLPDKKAYGGSASES